MDAKPWWASKTVWVNTLAGIAALSTAFGLHVGLDPDAQAAIVGGIMAVANIALRLVTKQPVSIKKEKSE